MGVGRVILFPFLIFLNRLYNRKLNEYVALKGGEDKILHNGKKNTDTISFKVEFENGKNGYAAKLQSGLDGFVFLKENLIYKGKDKYINRSNREALLKITDNFRANDVIKYLNGFRKYHFHDTGASAPFTKYSNIENDIHFLYKDGSNLAAFVHHIYDTNTIVYNRIIKTIQSIAPYFSDFYFSPNENGEIKLQWTDKYSDIVYGPMEFSDGTLRFIALTVLFLQPRLTDTIIIDEPELGLHSSAIAKLGGMIKSAAERGCQVIVATQSTDLISHFQPEDIITVDQEEGHSVLNRLDSRELAQWLQDYTLDDLWKRNVIIRGQPNYSL